MKKFLIILVTGLLYFNISYSEIVKTIDGRTIELKSDGTYKVIKKKIMTSDDYKKQQEEPEIIKNSMIEYMPDQINALLEKKYKKDVGKTILLKSVPIYAIDDSIWSSGGQLAILGDNSFPEWGVTCYLSHNDGERFLNSNFGQGVKVSLKGVIKSYSRRSGLRIDPCNFNTK